MAKSDDVNVLLDQINTATNDVKAFVEQLLADIALTASDGLNGPQTANVEERLTVVLNALGGMGQNQAQPFPAFKAPATAMPGPFA